MQTDDHRLSLKDKEWMEFMQGKNGVEAASKSLEAVSDGLVRNARKDRV